MTGILKPEDFLKNRVPVNLKVDEEEMTGLFFEVVSRPDSNDYEKRVCLFNLKDKKIRRIVLPFKPEDFLFFKGQILFKSFKDDKTVFHSYNRETDTSRELAKLPFRAGNFTFTDTNIYFTAEVQRPDPSSPVLSGNRSPFFQEGQGPIGDSLNCLFRANVDGLDISVISPLDLSVGFVDFDLEHKQIVYTASPLGALLPVASQIYLYNLELDDTSLFVKRNFRISYLKSIDSERIVFFGADLDEQSRNDNHRLLVVDTPGGAPQLLCDPVNLSNEHPSIVTDSFYSSSVPLQIFGGKIYFKLVERTGDKIYRVPIDGGEIESIETSTDDIGAFHVTESGIFLLAMKNMRPGELYFYSEDKCNRLSNLNGWSDQAVLAVPELFHFNYDNTEIDGYVYAPTGSKSEKATYPAILFIHGGPKMLYAPVYSHDIQLLCASGYYVFCANPSGSDGRGDEFSRIGGRFADLPFRQLMTFTDEVLKKFGQIDPGRLGVTGGSYGGYMTNYIITYTHRFGAAVSERGISDLTTSFNSSDIGSSYVYEYMGNNSTPWTDPETYRDASPISKVSDVKTPTLFIHGQKDYRCLYSESLNMFNALNYFGVETRLVLFPEESHSLAVRGRPQSKKERYREMVAWFDKFLKEKGDINE